MKTTPTGKTRFRFHNILFRQSLVVLQLQEHCVMEVCAYDAEVKFYRWRDATPNDIPLKA